MNISETEKKAIGFFICLVGIAIAYPDETKIILEILAKKSEKTK